ncbi:class I SAM-dependent methyltransferase [Nocardioides zeae]|uniref:Class I SAM-dependent methyltransferase n=1 Tax=Nocardioides imazamoxiresistens TaxID=3231893 RepID=A0ABU3Q100_9ACTN|nr:class I SAM-dependent methyltransferase [Nocardioides zeae]MDT9595181.1 class I SAM-dependent methyltransferase [Nocardioides zeae]
MTFSEVLFPGRHHAVTGFQVDFLHRLLAGEVRDADDVVVPLADDAVVVWAVTSANHAWTRRNPLPGHRREALVERVSVAADLPSLVVLVPDVPQHPRFAELVVTTVATALGHRPPPDPARTLVACSTPAVAESYRALGYTVVGVEDAVSDDADEQPSRPWEVVERLAHGDASWRLLAHPGTVAHYERYGVPELVTELFSDPVVSSEGDLTTTRDYRTYAASFETASGRKYDQVGHLLEPGRVVDVGCATGGLLERIAADPRFGESDLFGVDIARPLLDEAEHKKATGVFANPNIWFVRANILSGPVMPAGSVDSTVTVALTHEVFSYGAGRADVEAFARRVAEHTRVGGVWVNSDVLGPDEPDRVVDLQLRSDDGANPAAAREDLDALERAEVAAYVGGLSTDARMRQFAHDFPRLSGAAFVARSLGEGRWRLRLGDAMEFLTTKDYADNWLSECHESFCGLTMADWREVLTGAGLTLDPTSVAWRNDWLVSERFAPTARLHDVETGDELDWPVTHVLTVARRPPG